MSELVALTQCSLKRHRSVTIVLLALLFLGAATAWLLSLIFRGGDGTMTVSAVLFFSLMPTGIAALVLFDFGQENDLMSPASGCGQWLLLTPIAPWKIAIVPVVLKTVWISGVWLLFAAVATHLELVGSREVIPRFTPCVILSGSLIWVLAIAWRPFGSGWTRLASLALSLPVLYGSFGFVCVASQSTHEKWIAIATALSIAVYVLGIVLIIHAVKLAKTSGMGVVSESGVGGPKSESRMYRKRRLSGPVRALMWHDVARTSGFIRYVLVLGVIPCVVIATFFVPLNWGTLIIIGLLFTYFAGIATVGVSGRIQHQAGSTLPPYLVASPLSTATIAWTRLATILAIVLPVGSCILFVFAGWAIWSENRSRWYQWAAEAAVSSGSAGGTVSIGIRCSIAILLAAAVVAVGRLVSLLWVSMMDRLWVSVATVFASSLAVLGLVMVVLRWFLQQTDWESTSESAMGWLAFAPDVVAGLLTVKATLVIVATLALWKSRLTGGDRILAVLAIWVALTLSVATGLSVLVPDPRVSFVGCLAATALAVPLARILILPVSLSLNRHR